MKVISAIIETSLIFLLGSDLGDGRDHPTSLVEEAF
jgi:hypothetical protein